MSATCEGFSTFKVNMKHECSHKINIMILSILFFVSFIALASEKSPSLIPILRQIDQINQSGWPFNGRCGSSCPVPQDENALLHQCALDLCGPPHQNPKFIINNTNFSQDVVDPEVLTMFQKDIQPAIRQARSNIDNYYQKNKERLESIREQLNSDPDNLVWSHMANQIAVRLTTITQNQESIRFTLSPSDLEGMSQTTKDGLKSYIDKQNQIILASIHSIKGKPFDQAKQILAHQIQSLLSKSQDQKNSFNQLKRAVFTDLQGDLKYAKDNRDLHQLAGEVSMISLKLSDSSCSENSCKKMVTEQISELIDLIDQLKSDENQTDYISYCQSLFIEHSQAMKNTMTYREELPKYKEKFISTVFKGYSKLSRQQFEQYVNNELNIDMPSLNTTQYFKDYINERAISDSDQNDFDLTKIYYNAIRKSPEVCPPSIFYRNKDSFSTTFNEVKVSYMSCAFHDHGKQILAHELGHVASYLFNPKNQKQMSERSHTKYKKFRACATNRYKNIDTRQMIAEDFRHKDDVLRTEEDMADLLAYKVFQNSPTHTVAVECSLLDSNLNGTQYTDLKVLYEPENRDPHSPSFLRVLMEAIHKRKKLSSACQQVIERYKDKINFKPCF